MNKHKCSAIVRILHAFNYSYEGLKATFQSEVAFRQECLLLVITLPFALIIDVNATDKALMIGSILLILLAELINTAIEVIIDRISEEHHPLSRKAKDIGSAIVLVAFINSICIWSIILFN